MSRRTAGAEIPALPRWSRGDTISVTVVCALALAVRIVYLLCLRSSLFFDHLLINAAQYEGWARLGYPSDEPFFQSPLYVLWLRAMFVLSSESSWLLVARLWQILMGTASTLLAFTAARWLAGRGAGIAAGLFTGLAGMSVYFDLEILPTSLATLLLSAVLTGHIAASVLPRTRPGRFLWPVVATLLGLAVITRPNFLVLLPFLAAHRWWLLSPTASGRRLRLAGLYLALALLPVILVAARNTSTGQGFVLLTTSAGDNLLLAHNPQADGFNPFPPKNVTLTLQEYEHLGMNMVQRSAAAQDRALRWMQQNPRATAAMWWKKLALFYNRADIPNNRSIREQKRHCAVLRLPPLGWVGMGLLLPLALAGVLFLHKKDLRFLFLFLLLSVPVSLMPFLVCARFRTPLIPALAMLAGVGASSLVAAAKHRNLARRQVLCVIAGIVVGALIAWPDWYGVQSLEFPRLATNRARLYRTVAEQQRAAGNQPEADRWMGEVTATLERAVAEHPQDATAHLWLADMNLEAQQLDLARHGYETAARLDSSLAEAHTGLARVALRQKQVESALGHYRRAHASKPGDVGLAVEYAEVLFRQGQQENARGILRTQLQRGDLTPQERQGLEQLLRRLGGR